MSTPTRHAADREEFRDAVGSVLDGRYRLKRLIGTGSMGGVFEGEHLGLGTTVAIKLLRRALVSNPGALRRFLHEARTAATLRHPNIVATLDVCADGPQPYIVLEYLQGENFGALIAREAPMALDRAIAIMIPVLDALGYAHENGVVHRDVKPDNVLLSSGKEGASPVPIVVDFGLAKREAPSDVRMTGSRIVLGTPAYMAPEQVTASRDVTGAADQYAAAAMLFEALTRRIPHEVADGGDLMIAKLTQPATDISTLRPDIGVSISAAIMRALAQDPSDRFSSVTGFRQELTPGAGPASGAAARASVGAAGDRAVSREFAARDARDASIRFDEPTNALGANRSRARWKAWPLAVSLSAALCAGLGGWALGHREVAPNARPERPRIVLHVRVRPPTAEILLDGAIVGHGSADLERVRDGRHYHLTLRADGYRPMDIYVQSFRSTVIERTLEPNYAGGATPPYPPQTP